MSTDLLHTTPPDAADIVPRPGRLNISPHPTIHEMPITEAATSLQNALSGLMANEQGREAVLTTMNGAIGSALVEKKVASQGQGSPEIDFQLQFDEASGGMAGLFTINGQNLNPVSFSDLLERIHTTGEVGENRTDVVALQLLYTGLGAHFTGSAVQFDTVAGAAEAFFATIAGDPRFADLAEGRNQLLKVRAKLAGGAAIVPIPKESGALARYDPGFAERVAAGLKWIKMDDAERELIARELATLGDMSEDYEALATGLADGTIANAQQVNEALKRIKAGAAEIVGPPAAPATTEPEVIEPTPTPEYTHFTTLREWVDYLSKRDYSYEADSRSLDCFERRKNEYFASEDSGERQAIIDDIGYAFAKSPELSNKYTGYYLSSQHIFERAPIGLYEPLIRQNPSQWVEALDQHIRNFRLDGGLTNYGFWHSMWYSFQNLDQTSAQRLITTMGQNATLSRLRRDTLAVDIDQGMIREMKHPENQKNILALRYYLMKIPLSDAPDVAAADAAEMRTVRQRLAGWIPGRGQK